MQLGMIGLGRMGGNMVRRLMQGGHDLFVYDRSAEAVQQMVHEGATVDWLAGWLVGWLTG